MAILNSYVKLPDGKGGKTYTTCSCENSPPVFSSMFKSLSGRRKGAIFGVT